MKERDRMRIVELSGVSLSTVRKWSKGGEVTKPIKVAIEAAAKKLNLKREVRGG